MSYYSTEDRRALHREMIEAVMAVEPNPAGWLLVLRRVVESLGLDPSNCIPLGGVTLLGVCLAVVRYADANCVPPTTVRQVLTTLRSTA